MGVDVLNLLWLYLGILESIEHDAVGAVAVFRRLGDVISIPAHAITDNFSHDPRTAPAGKLQFLEHHNARAFADYESVAPRIPGTAGLLGIVITGGKGTHGG